MQIVNIKYASKLTKQNKEGNGRPTTAQFKTLLS